MRMPRLHADPRHSPCVVRKVVVHGLQHTHRSVVTQELASLKRAATLGEIGEGCVTAAAHLKSLDIFESADLLLDAAPPGFEWGVQA